MAKKPQTQEQQEKSIEKYARGVEELDAVLEGLSETQLDLSRGEGKWTIRQIIHHISDAEDIWKICIKAALGNPGCTVDLSWYIVDNKCAVPLDYAHRPVLEALELFRASRRQVVELVKALPEAWNQSFTTTWSNTTERKTFSVGEVISFQIFHLNRHIKQIQDTRKKSAARTP